MSKIPTVPWKTVAVDLAGPWTVRYKNYQGSIATEFGYVVTLDQQFVYMTKAQSLARSFWNYYNQ